MLVHLQIGFYIGNNILMLYIINSALNIFFESKKKLLNKFITYMLYIILGTITYFLVSIAWLNVIFSAILIFLVSMNFLGTLKSKFIIACSYAVFIMITEILVSVFYIAISKENFENILLNQITNFIAVTIHTLVMLLIIKGFSVYVSKYRLLEKLTIYDSLYICVIPICSIFLLYFLAQMSFHYRIPYSICILFCFLVIFINVFFFTIFDKLRLSEKLKYENALLRNQAEYFLRLEENANNTFEKVRQVKHDLKYKLLYIKSMTEENTSESLTEIGTFVNTLIDDTLSEKMIEYTKNKSINRLLNYKLFSMSKSNIELDIKISIRDDAYIDEVSLFIILGNAIDNAVRNFDNSISETNSMVVRIIDDYDNLFIKVSNPYSKKLKFKNGLPITDKVNKEFHGIGLQSIKDLVEQKNGYFKITSTANVFTVEVLLYDEIKKKK